MTNQPARNSMIEVLRFLSHAETFLRKGNNTLKLRYSFLFDSSGSVKKKQKGKEILTVHGMVLYLCLSRK